MKTVAVLASLDTKGAEVGFVCSIIRNMGVRALIVDTGLLGVPSITPDVTRDQVALASGSTSEDIVAQQDKAGAMASMTRGAAVVARQLYEAGRIDGLLALGGAQGTGIGTAAMRALPLGVPKLMVSTIACGATTFGPFVGTSDVTIMHSVADIAGINLVSRTVLSQAAGAIVGMVSAVLPPVQHGREAIGLTMVGITTTGAIEVQRILEAQGYEVIAFHGNGVGPKAMEELVDAGLLSAVIDLSPHDATDLLFGGLMPAHGDRFRAAARRHIPIIVSPGATDIVLRGPVETVPATEQNRRRVIHNALHTHVRTSPAEMRAIGRYIGTHLADLGDMAALYIPTHGYSQLNCAGGPLYDPEADHAFVQGAREAAQHLRIVEVDAHINDPAFAQTIAGAMLERLAPAAVYATQR